VLTPGGKRLLRNYLQIVDAAAGKGGPRDEALS
jgi:hypothetical protein